LINYKGVELTFRTFDKIHQVDQGAIVIRDKQLRRGPSVAAGRAGRDQRDFAAHMDYTHFNPVKHGLVEHPADWPYSSFRRCVASGLYPDGWRGGSDEPQQTGERL